MGNPVICVYLFVCPRAPSNFWCAASKHIVLYSDGSVQTFEMYDLRTDGVIDEEEELLLVGPDSPVEDLRKFSLN